MHGSIFNPGMQKGTLRTISDAAAEAGVSVITLRAYETRGAISPERDSSGRRLYTPQDIAAAKQFREQLRHRQMRPVAERA